MKYLRNLASSSPIFAFIVAIASKPANTNVTEMKRAKFSDVNRFIANASSAPLNVANSITMIPA